MALQEISVELLKLHMSPQRFYVNVFITLSILLGAGPFIIALKKFGLLLQTASLF